MSRFYPRFTASELNDGANAGGYASVPRTAGAEPTAPKPASNKATGTAPSKIQFDAAEKRGVARERARIRAVFASEASHGRERLCANLLTTSDGWAAATIISKLPNLSTDAELAAKAKVAHRAKADSVWDRAWVSIDGGAKS